MTVADRLAFTVRSLHSQATSSLGHLPSARDLRRGRPNLLQ